jgi:hypothetical protein
MRFRALTTLLLLLFFASLASLVLITKKPLCIDSKVVEKIDRVSDSGTSSVWRCALNRSVPYDEKVAQEIPDLSRRLSGIERFFDDEVPLNHKITLVWLDGMNKTIRIQGTKIFISDDLLRSTDQLERSILRIWLREKSGEAVMDRTLLEGTLVDLLMATLGQDQVEGGALHWPVYLQSIQSFCQDMNMSSQDDDLFADMKDRYLICPNSDLDENSDLHAILVASARPLLSEAAVNAYMGLDLKQKTVLLKSLPNLLQHVDQFSSSSLMTEESSVQGVPVLHHELESIVHLISQFSLADSSPDDPWIKFNKEFRQQLNRHGFFQDESVARLDDLIELGPDLSFSSEVLEKIRHGFVSSSLVGIADDTSLWMLPSGLPLQKRIFGALQAHQLMYLSCEIPSTEKILSFSKVADKFLYVRFCGDFSDLNFHSYFQRGYSGFADDNPKVAFVQIHIPSMLQAMNNKTAPIPALAKILANELSIHPAINEPGSKPPIWDEAHKMYKTQSAIQAIEAYRPL